MFKFPNTLASAGAQRLASLRVSASGISLSIDSKNQSTVPPGSILILDLRSLHLGLFYIAPGQAPQRIFSKADQFALPDNPASSMTDERGSLLLKPGVYLPVGVVSGNSVLPTELMATTIGARTSVEAVFAQKAEEMNAAGAAGRDVSVAVTFAGTQVVPMGGGNSFRLILNDIKVIDTPQAMIDFRPQFMAVIEHAKRTPMKLPAPTSFANPATFTAPAGTTAGWAPPVTQPPGFGAYPATPAYQPAPMQPMPMAQPVAQMPPAAAPAWQPPVAQQPAATPPWLQAPHAPMAPPAPDDGAD